MTSNINDKIIAYLTLFSGLALTVVAEFYSISGLAAIFSASVVSVVVMGIALGIGKIVGTIWLKQNWKIALLSIKIYLLTAISILVLITSLGIFGLLSKAHSDQTLVSGDVIAKIGIYDEKIKIAKENIEFNRKALKQLDDAVDQVMGRSSDEKGADKAVAIRRGQSKERARLLTDIETEQKTISRLNEERAPIAAEVRKVEADVGPIKYIAAFFYGTTDPAVLERAVTWVILLLIMVFDPLALMLLIVSQISFQRLQEDNTTPDPYIADVGEKPTTEELLKIEKEDASTPESAVVSNFTVTNYQFLDEESIEDDYIPLQVHARTDTIQAQIEPVYEVKRIYVPEDEPEPTPEPPKNLVPIIQREESRVVKTKIFKRPGSQE